MVFPAFSPFPTSHLSPVIMKSEAAHTKANIAEAATKQALTLTIADDAESTHWRRAPCHHAPQPVVAAHSSPPPFFFEERALGLIAPAHPSAGYSNARRAPPIMC